MARKREEGIKKGEGEKQRVYWPVGGRRVGEEGEKQVKGMNKKKEEGIKKDEGMKQQEGMDRKR